MVIIDKACLASYDFYWLNCKFDFSNDEICSRDPRQSILNKRKWDFSEYFGERKRYDGCVLLSWHGGCIYYALFAVNFV